MCGRAGLGITLDTYKYISTNLSNKSRPKARHLSDEYQSVWWFKQYPPYGRLKGGLCVARWITFFEIKSNKVVDGLVSGFDTTVPFALHPTQKLPVPRRARRRISRPPTKPNLGQSLYDASYETRPVVRRSVGSLLPWSDVVCVPVFDRDPTFETPGKSVDRERWTCALDVGCGSIFGRSYADVHVRFRRVMGGCLSARLEMN